MNSTIIANFNSKVKKEDTTYHLGDFTLRGSENWPMVKGWVNKLNGKHVLILGNHDKLNPFTYEKCGFHSVHTYLTLNYVQSDNLILHLVHDPAKCNVDLKRKWLCGHIHNIFKKQGNIINVGVDVWNFFPVSLEEIGFMAVNHTLI